MRISGIRPSFISDTKPHKVLLKIAMRFLKIPKQVEVKHDGVINPYNNTFYLFSIRTIFRTLGIKRSRP